MSNIEHWKDIPSYEGLYQVSNLGNVRSLNFNRQNKVCQLSLSYDTYGYYKVVLSKNGNTKRFKVHRLVLLSFLGDSDLQVNHKNGIKTDNKLCNLEYCTPKENVRHAWKIGLIKR